MNFSSRCSFSQKLKKKKEKKNFVSNKMYCAIQNQIFNLLVFETFNLFISKNKVNLKVKQLLEWRNSDFSPEISKLNI